MWGKGGSFRACDFLKIKSMGLQKLTLHLFTYAVDYQVNWHSVCDVNWQSVISELTGRNAIATTRGKAPASRSFSQFLNVAALTNFKSRSFAIPFCYGDIQGRWYLEQVTGCWMNVCGRDSSPALT